MRRRGRGPCRRQVASACGQAPQFEDVPDVAKRMSDNALAISRMRNRNPQVASMLRAAVAEIERLKAEMNEWRTIWKDKPVSFEAACEVVRIMHDQVDAADDAWHSAEKRRIEAESDRNSLRAKLAEVEKELDEARENACTRHVATCHGGEAEELRRGIEDIIKNTDWKDMRTELLRLLDDVCARDSLAILEKLDAAEHRATQAEAALGEMTKERDWAVAVQRAALESQERLGTNLAAALQAKDELADIAEMLSNQIVKFPATGGPTQADRRITELCSVGKEKP
jgi:hypothetical protein